MSHHPGGPEDVIDSGDKFDPLFGDIGESELTTALHRADLWAAHLRRADGTPLPDPSPAPRNSWQAMVPDPGHVVVSHRREPWWRRGTDWLITAVRVAALGAVVAAGFLFWTAYRQQRAYSVALAAYDAALADARANVLLPDFMPPAVPPSAPLLYTASTALVFALGGLLLLFMSVLASDGRRGR